MVGSEKVGWVSPPAVIETVPVNEIETTLAFAWLAVAAVQPSVQKIKRVTLFFGDELSSDVICPRLSNRIVTGKTMVSPATPVSGTILTLLNPLKSIVRVSLASRLLF